MDHRQHFYDRYTTAQSRFASIDDTRARVAVEHLGLEASVAHLLPTNYAARIVDLGCGYGAFLLLVQKKGFSNLRGVDLSPEQIQLAKELGLSCVEVDSLFLALQSEHNVSLITMFDVIEHLTRSEASRWDSDLANAKY
ncbi:MAG: class I SAM-dependent methyltransferase [Candidatus Kapabacteria bacterium]|nr:class I SAM-dependent methyltransferase [Candidatus Kapabacteria bacterium]